ncbi:MAG: hypothetical protein J2P53_15435, partial [Bradyrhizobiaceae bacterium]|nr:hypothetical protein [Bradyrhizobiaceae bacterium]
MASAPASRPAEGPANTGPANIPATTSPATTGPVTTSPTTSSPDTTGADDGTDTCAADQTCVDRYLFSLYMRTPKIDTVNVPEQKQVTVTRKGKTKTVTKTEMKIVGEDFAWKDPKAADLAGMPLKDYVIGGMDQGFKATLYHALRALDDAGFKPGIMCAFRDDYRQSIATGLKAQNDRSFHGGSFRGGYGHGMAADIVSVKGETRTERLAASAQMWDYIDGHENELGIGRPYRDRDPPHVGPIDGEEYADHRLRPKTPHPASQAKSGTKDSTRSANRNANKNAAKNANRNATGGIRT